MRLAATMILLTAAASGQAAAPPDGARVFQQRCAACHTVQKLAPVLAKQPANKREAELRRMLERHYPPRTAADKDALVAWLLKETAR